MAYDSLSVNFQDSYLHIDDPNKLCKLSDDEGIGLPDNNQVKFNKYMYFTSTTSTTSH